MNGYVDVNEAKAGLDHIYNQPDPRAYFRTLARYDYNIPDAAKPIFSALIEARGALTGRQVHMVDICCSYGVNAALQKFDLSFDALAERWSQPAAQGASVAELLAMDREFFGNLPAKEKLKVTGIDAAERAVGYAHSSGVLDDALSANLEAEALPGDFAEGLGDADLVTSTGAVGYVGKPTFAHLLPAVAAGRRPWFANFVLRCFPFGDIADMFAGEGYRTHKLSGETFRQRRFIDADERDAMVAELEAAGIDPADYEAAGHLYAELFLTYPEEDEGALPPTLVMAG